MAKTNVNLVVKTFANYDFLMLTIRIEGDTIDVKSNFFVNSLWNYNTALCNA